ncbi:trafficking kinesin-binding protein 1 [Biomphalaria pfeifferi]|uniref:Trafficking kinesin-binding protein 1 n=1 Tax=Biomphalaria pfeifferi TaxID=112525 RepID=A0AAD8EZI9_BIOPF|nr:trafficking kinesin-binding protein 1 [Biomphalaria pfeifferi]
MYRSINSNALQRSMTFDLTDGINNNFIAGDGMTERHVGSPGEGVSLDDNDNSRHAFHPPVLVFSRPMLAQCTFRPLDADNFQEYNKELVDILSADNAHCRVRHSDDMGINFHNNKINSFRSKRSATAPNSPGPYCKKDNQHLWKSFSAAPSRKNSIHYETLESVTVAELYNVAEDADQSNDDTPHASGHTTPNDNAAEDTPAVVEPASPRDGPVTEDLSLLRSRTESVSFVKLFNRIRLERDASFESISSDGQSDPKVLDQDMVDNSVYDLLCAERVSQMTKTYNDIEAVTRLLEEKERDLELAARIGQTLLSKNKELSNRTESLEDQLTQANDKVNQLRHDLSMKEELLRFYNEDLELQHGADVTPNEKPAHGINVDFLERKVKNLEDENLNLRLESAQLKSETDNLEEKEKRLVEDCIQQLAEVNQQVESLAEELHHKVEENNHQKEEITGFLAQIAELQKKIRLLTLDNMDLHEKLTASQESQRRLTKELGSMQDKYDELLEMLEETQDELRIAKGKHKVKASGQHHHSAFAIPTDSLASELETSLQQELSQSTRRAQSWKVFETARAAKRAAAKAAERESTSSTRMSLLSVPTSHNESDSQNQSAYPSDVESFASDGYSADMDSLYGSNPELGRPGIPGSNDLESALKRLAMRRANELNERDFHEEERRKKKEQESMQSGATSPFGTKSPGSVKSYQSGYSNNWSNLPGSGLSSYKMSDKLQIVKPLEGSMTLRHWQHLATPHLGGIFEERDGVQIRGEKKLDLVEEVYSLSDFEEDDDPNVHTRKEQDSSLIYTFTDSTVRNPGPYRGLGTLSSMNSSTSEFPVHSSTPKAEPLTLQAMAQDNTQSTYSMSLGLAALLQSRESAGSDKHAVSRVSAPKFNSASAPDSKTSLPSTQATSPLNLTDLNQRVLSRSVALSSPRTLPGSRSFEQIMKEREHSPQFSLDEADRKEPSLFPPGMTGQGFLQQLKNKGYSLYGLWGGKPKEETASSADSSTDAVGGATAAPVEDPKASAKSVFVNGSGVGVLGALTSFRRSGIL